MLRQEVTIVNKLGLHARAAAKLVGCTSAFASRIKLGKDGSFVDAKSIMSVMRLAATCGTVLKITTDGEDADEAVEALVALVQSGFGSAEMNPEPPASIEDDGTA